MLIPAPPMGWNTWNTFGANISEALIKAAADRVVELGLREAGYAYIVIDDCWSLRERDPRTHEIVADPAKFPGGLKALADYIHGRGLKFGMYSCAGVRTCADYPGSFGHEFLDARTFASFGVDFLKYDYCNVPVSGQAPLLYRRMGQALRACGRDILFSACNWGTEEVGSWIRSTGAHMYRSTGDIADNFKSMSGIATGQIPRLSQSAPHCFNDLDMLTVGMFGKGNVGSSGCTLADYQTQFALWALMGSPLMLGCDPRTMTPEIVQLVTNRGLLRINQDPAGLQAYRVNHCWGNPDCFTLARLLEGGDLALGFFNLSENPCGNLLLLEQIGLTYESGLRLRLVDCFTGEEQHSGRDTVTVPKLPPHGCRVFRCTPVEA